MYYYILEAPQSRAVRQTYQRLRDILTNLGIGGEMVVGSPARTSPELATMGINKGYTTIVAVGSDALVGQVASTILGRAVLGVIPINASLQVTDLIGTSNVREAAEALKQRRLTTVSTVVVGEDLPIFLDGTITTPSLAKVSLVIDNRVRAFAYFNSATINRSLEISIKSVHQTEQRKILGLFNVGGDAIRSESLFHGKLIRLVTDPVLDLKIGGLSVAKTPLQLRLVPESLKVITRRGTLD